MEELNLKIEQYEGPLDLLLALIAKNKLNIFDIPIAEIAEQYMAHIEAMRRLNMEVTSEFIYYAAGESLEKIDKLPQTEGLRESGTEILYFTEEVDEFCAQILHTFQDKEFRSVLDQEIEEGAEKKAEEAADAHKAVFDFVKETLGDQVKEVKASARLKSHPVCLTAGEGLSFEMEKYFKRVDPNSGMKADRILEFNADHPIFAKLQIAVAQDEKKAEDLVKILYTQALLMADLPVESAGEYTDLVCSLIG